MFSHVFANEVGEISPEIFASIKNIWGLETVGVRFVFKSSDDSSKLPLPPKAIRFCEAVGVISKSLDPLDVGRTPPHQETIALTGECISCPAARRAFGFACDGFAAGSKCLQELMECGRFSSPAVAMSAFSKVPSLEKPPSHIILTTNDPHADVYLMFMKPEDFMLMVQAYQGLEGNELTANLSSVMPICGNCTVRPICTGEICLSFGCGDSRRYGKLHGDQIAVGITPGVLEKLVSRINENNKIEGYKE